MIGEIKVHLIKRSSRVDEGYHNIPCSLGDSEPLMPVGEPARVHEAPAQPGLGHTTVVAQEPTPTALQNQLQLNATPHTVPSGLYLIVDTWSREGHVDGVGGGVVVRPQAGLALRVVLHHKVHDSMALQITAHMTQLPPDCKCHTPWSGTRGTP